MLDSSGTGRTTTDLLCLALVQRSLKARYTNRRFFRADYGFVGIGPDNIESGDLVTKVFGPFMLRSFSVFSKIVGAAYVHSILREERRIFMMIYEHVDFLYGHFIFVDEIVGRVP
jgi:hypothetical protein